MAAAVATQAGAAPWLVVGWIAIGVGACSAVVIAADVLRGNRQPIAIMNWVYPSTALYWGPVAAGLYFRRGHWVMRHELDEAGILLEYERCSRLAFGNLLGLLRTEERERSSIFSAAADALQAYSSEHALNAARDPNFDATRFVSSRFRAHPCARALLGAWRSAG